MNTYIISDTHFRHTNIIKYCNRPFKTTDEMDVTLINNINSVVEKDDRLIHLGDVSFGREANVNAVLFLLNQIKCQNVELILGNHDRIIRESKVLQKRFTKIYEYLLEEFCGVKCLLIHRPYDEKYPHCGNGIIKREQARNPNLVVIYGHVHNNVSDRHNVSVENIGYKPILIDKLLKG